MFVLRIEREKTTGVAPEIVGLGATAQTCIGSDEHLVLPAVRARGDGRDWADKAQHLTVLEGQLRPSAPLVAIKRGRFELPMTPLRATGLL